MVGKVISVCVSQRRTDPKKNVGEGFLQKGFGLVDDSHAGTEKEVSLLAIESIRKLCRETGLSAGPGSFAENITTEVRTPTGRRVEDAGRKTKMPYSCAKCDKQIEKQQGYEHQGKLYCEDCYMDILSPPKACDPWAVHSAQTFLKGKDKLSTLTPGMCPYFSIQCFRRFQRVSFSKT